MDPIEREQSIQTANQSGIYITILVGVAISIIGAFLRFAFDSVWLSLASWIILFVGAIICCMGVFKILDAK